MSFMISSCIICCVLDISPDKIYRIACRAFDGIYDKETIMKWLKTFYRRFFAQQFKRSCLPDGPKVGSCCRCLQEGICVCQVMQVLPYGWQSWKNRILDQGLLSTQSLFLWHFLWMIEATDWYISDHPDR